MIAYAWQVDPVRTDNAYIDPSRTCVRIVSEVRSGRIDRAWMGWHCVNKNGFVGPIKASVGLVSLASPYSEPDAACVTGRY